MWTMLDTSDTSHKSQIGLCDMHLAYMGSNTYNLLCKPNELKTKARKLLNHKYGQSNADTTKDLQIKLLKAEYLTQWPDNLIITQESMKKLKQYRMKTPGESLPSSHGNHLQKPNNEELYNTSTVTTFKSQIMRNCTIPVWNPTLTVRIQSYIMSAIAQNYMNLTSSLLELYKYMIQKWVLPKQKQA